ncbi:hypothetical protein LPU83_pLPU83c_0164 (plasmid) [Rhizobium favelukesii]|uniref:Uncharacterized protein n=1 Tax=Rhizobium favelukesii TaxID=348824 RepID=W6S2V9_9HYPH|nr:hypothetical protein LPU83_pLPU83c_0164 [Rhizobium favelukesii]
MAVATIKVSSEKQGGELQKVVELLGGARTLSRRLTNALNAHELLLSSTLYKIGGDFGGI